MDQLSQQRERVQEDLRGLIAGEVRCDDVFLQLFASDASIYEIKPLGVVRPRSTGDVAACVRYASENQIPVHPRGAGTSMAGESLGAGLVIDFSKYMRRILDTGAQAVRVQPGVVHERLNNHLRKHGRIFGPNPATSSVTTIGSTIAIDGAGSRYVKYGSARQHVLALQVVLADGSVMEFAREPLGRAADANADPRKRALVERLADLLGRRGDLIRQGQPGGMRHHGGYNLAGVLQRDHPDGGYLDLARLVVGSEGTLALITEALLATQPVPQFRGVALLLFDSLDAAARAVEDVLPHRPSTCDLMDRRHVSLAREAEVRFDLLIPRETEAVLLVEHEGDDAVEVRERLQRLVQDVDAKKRPALGSRLAFDASETDLFLRLAVMAQPGLYRMKGPTRPIPVVEDMAVPPPALPGFLVRVQNVLKQHQVTASLFCHAGQGQLHLQPFLDLGNPADVRRMRCLADDLYAQLFEAGGTVSSEHGCGLSRTPYLARQYGDLYAVFREVKQLFDPKNILNPGKIVGDDPDLLSRNLRPAIVTPAEPAPAEAAQAESSGLRNLVELQMDWAPALVADVARRCNGCGKCRSQSPNERMCPIFRILPAEESSPRAKANLIRGVLTGRLDLSSLGSDRFKQVADLCFNCHACRLECPAAVDIPKLMTEAKGAYVAANGLSLTDWVMTRLDLLAALGSLFGPLTNGLLASRWARWLLEKTLGIAQGRKLPRVAARSFLRRAARRRLTRPTRHGGRKVAYFVDTYANQLDPQLAEALVAVLDHNGIEVYVPPAQKQAGTPAISLGALERARSLAEHNVPILAEAVRQGYHVVTTEPAAALTLTREYLNLIDDDESRLVAENTSDASTYLWRLHTNGTLRLDLNPIHATIGYHMPCRLRALQVGSPSENLLKLIPGLTICTIDEGCSGMAGTFGLKRENYRTSLRVGWALISRLRDPQLHAGTTECSTCKIQMEQGTTKPTIHPIKLLALAYGLMPEIARLLTAPGEELIAT
jgi:FAD/FMN-containing dehydrogenase/Fe-S oxidoreductase